MAYTRKTRDVYDIEVNYGYGFECVTTEVTFADAKKMKKCYIENEHCPTRIKKRREKLNENLG